MLRWPLWLTYYNWGGAAFVVSSRTHLFVQNSVGVHDCVWACSLFTSILPSTAAESKSSLLKSLVIVDDVLTWLSNIAIDCGGRDRKKRLLWTREFNGSMTLPLDYYSSDTVMCPDQRHKQSLMVEKELIMFWAVLPMGLEQWCRQPSASHLLPPSH